MKRNTSENYESLCVVKLTKDKFPIAYENKVAELMEECGYTRKEAEEIISDMEIELEIYYEKGFGLFAVESEAVDCNGEIYSPYTKDILAE